MQVPFNEKTKNRVLAASIAAIFGGASVPALADTEALVEKLHEKGVLSDEEYEQMSAEAKAENADKLTGSYKGGFKWATPDGKHSIQLTGRVQLDYRSYDNQLPADGFDIRRVYLGVSGKLYKDWTYSVVTNLDGGDLEFAYLDYKWNDAAKVRIGAMKFLYSLEELTSSRFTDFQERSLVNAWVPGKDVGLMFHGEPTKNVWAYGLGYANGEGKNSNESSVAPVEDGKDLIARVAVNFAPLTGWNDGVLHLGGNLSTGSRKAASPGKASTEARGLTFFTATAPTGNSMDRDRSNIEGMIAFGPFKLQTEYNTANYSGDAGYDRDIDTSYVAASWMITGESFVTNYGLNGMKTIKPIKSVGSGGWGAWEVGLRYSTFDAAGFANTAASTNKADALTVGVKWMPNEVTRFIFNYVDTQFDTPITSGTEQVGAEKAITLRAQIYF